MIIKKKTAFPGFMWSEIPVQYYMIAQIQII